MGDAGGTPAPGERPGTPWTAALAALGMLALLSVARLMGPTVLQLVSAPRARVDRVHVLKLAPPALVRLQPPHATRLAIHAAGAGP